MFSIDRAIIRTMTEADIPDVREFVKQTFSDEIDFYESYYPIESRIPVVVAEQQGELLGVAAVYHNTLHPYWVDSMIAYQRASVGKD